MTASDLQRLRHADFNAMSGQRIPPGRAAGARHPPAIAQSSRRAGCARARAVPRALARRDAPTPRAPAAKSCAATPAAAHASRCRCWCWWTCRARWSAMRACCWLSCMRPRATAAPARRVCLRHPPDRPHARLPAGRHRRHAGAASAAIERLCRRHPLGRQSLATLRQQHARRLVGRRTLVLLISDGLDTGEPDVLAARTGLAAPAQRRLLWLNPLLRFDGYAPLARGAAVLHRTPMACWRCTTWKN
jgi:hypothetical protein